MLTNPKFWISMILFQTVFGLTVFFLTREYYTQDMNQYVPSPVKLTQMSKAVDGPVADLKQYLDTSKASRAMLNNPEVISRHADMFFSNKQYDKAAELYEQLIRLEPKSVSTYNNLGITLQYLGRSAEALKRLNEGISVDPGYQRIWLTLGFINSQIGDFEEARKALEKAVDMDPDNEVGQGAFDLLMKLPITQ